MAMINARNPEKGHDHRISIERIGDSVRIEAVAERGQSGWKSVVPIAQLLAGIATAMTEKNSRNVAAAANGQQVKADR